MGFAERLAQCCVTSDMKAEQEKIRPVEHVAALAGATSIGSDIFRARDYDANALRRAIFLLARKVRQEMRLAMEPSMNLASAAIAEVVYWQCRSCKGAAVLVIGTGRQVCNKCGGTGVHRWNDHDRAKSAGYNEDTWPKWAPKYEKVVAMARKHDGATIGLAHKRMG